MIQVAQGTYAQTLYNNGAGIGTDKGVRKAVIKTIEDLKPAEQVVPGNPVDAEKTVIGSYKTNNVLSAVRKIYNRQGAGSISITLLGETHNNPTDTARANALIAQMAAGNITPTFLIQERGMTYAWPNPYGGAIAREENLTTVPGGNFGLGLTSAQRSMVVAGYIFLCLAGGPQVQTPPPVTDVIDKVFLFYGENHKDILDQFEYFARHSTANWVQNRARNLVVARSSV
jgi:hypothetical protein